MAEYLDFFNVYIMGVVEMSFQFYFLAKILKKKMWPPFYFLFSVGAAEQAGKSQKIHGQHLPMAEKVFRRPFVP